MNHVFLSACPSSNHPPIQLFVLILSLLESTCISCESSILTIVRMLSLVLCCLVRVFFSLCFLLIILIVSFISYSVFFVFIVFYIVLCHNVIYILCLLLS